MYCEMVKMDALVRNDSDSFHLLDFDETMHPIGGQLCGSKPQIAGQAARIIESLGFDVIDLNCGCPVDKVTKDGSGSGLLRNPELIGDLIANIVAAVKIPVTVKIRAGWDEEHLCAPLITEIAEKAGACAITIHGRTRAQGYEGLANRDVIKQCKQAANKIKVIGNGDIFDIESALHMFDYTGCDAILVARGTMGQPWIADDIHRALAGLPAIERTTMDYLETLMEHFAHIVAYANDKQAVLDMRRVGCWYCKNAPGMRDLRGLISKVKSLTEIKAILEEYAQNHLMKNEYAQAL
jgi:tRNA-dihydrouridine synthase B